MKKILLSLAFLAGVSLTVSAQFKIGGKTINTKKVINAATDVAHAATLSDEDVAKMAKEYIQWMDTHNEVAGPDTEMGQRLERLTANVKKVSGLDLNFKVYNVVDVNAFACGDGSVRVCGGLMKIMPFLSACYVIAGFASLGLPGLSGFVAEMTIFIGSFEHTDMFHRVFTIIACTSIVITAVYILRVVGKLLYGEVQDKHHLALTDATWFERLSVITLIVAVAGLGIAPSWIADMISQSFHSIIERL